MPATPIRSTNRRRSCTLVNFLEQQPDWKNTAVIITWDDSDGWYDHAAAPRPTSPSFDPRPISSTATACAAPARRRSGVRRQAGQRPLRPRHAHSVPGDLAVGEAKPSRTPHLAGLGRAVHRGQLAARRAARRRVVRCERRFDHGHVRLPRRRTRSAAVLDPRTGEPGRPRTDAAHRRSPAIGALLTFAARDARSARRCRPATTRIRCASCGRRSAPLSAMAQLGRRVFFDRTLSSSGRLSCASCHSPQHAYGPPNDLPVMQGGAALCAPGRARGAVADVSRAPTELQHRPGRCRRTRGATPTRRRRARGVRIAPKSAQNAAQSAQNLVPQGGLFWDGRVEHAAEPGARAAAQPARDGRRQRRARRGEAAPRAVCGADRAVVRPARIRAARAWRSARRCSRSRAIRSRSRAFHPYSSKYDAWLEGKARLTPAEARGLTAVRRSGTARTARRCHLDRPDANGLPPLFTDHQFEALGVPRNAALRRESRSRAISISASAGRCAPT